MIPRTLQDWSIEIIEVLLALGYLESESFDWKEKLPHAKDELGRDRLAKSCAAFANSEGGFFIVGISDDSTLKLEDRLVGLAPGSEFFEHFGVYPQKCRPTVPWEPRNPPLGLPSGRVIHVIQIPKSWNGPHCCNDREGGLIFPKRTNKGTELMSYDEIRGAFLGYYEKRLKLQLLRSEIESIRDTSQSMLVMDELIDSHYSLATFDLEVIESVLSDTYTILVTKPSLLRQLSEIRRLCKIVNNRIRIFFNEVGLPSYGKNTRIRDLNGFLRGAVPAIESAAKTALRELESII